MPQSFNNHKSHKWSIWRAGLMVKHRREFNHDRFNPLLGLLIGCLSLSLPAVASEPSGASKSETVLKSARQVVEDTAFATLITIDQAGQPKARTVDAFAPDGHPMRQLPYRSHCTWAP